MFKRHTVTIPTPRPDTFALMESVNALKEQVELMSGSRGDSLDFYISFRDLLTLGIMVTEDDGSSRQLNESDLARIKLIERSSGRS